MNFRKLVDKNEHNDCSSFRTFSNPLFSLIHMASRNNATTKYLAVEENFLLAAIHVAALKNIPFREGILPELPAKMPSAPSGYVSCVPYSVIMKTNPSSGFKDEESFHQFTEAFDSYIRECQAEGYTSSPAQVGARSPFQLAVMISPLYLLVTLRLSTKSFHRRNVIDIAARLGAHKTPRILAVENLIWDAIFRLAEGRTAVHTVLRDLADSLPWSDIHIASNCDADKQWFAPGPSTFPFFSCPP